MFDSDVDVDNAESVEDLKKKLRQSEEEYNLLRERYNLATTAAHVGVWDWNIETGEFYLDPNVKAILGYSDHEIPNDLEIWAGYVHPEDQQAVMEAAQEHLDGKSDEYLFEHRMMHKDGSVRWILVRGQAIYNEHGRPIRMNGTDVDITDRKRIEEKKENNALNIIVEFIIKTLKGILPICSSCKKIRDDRGSWEIVERYIQKYTDARFTHGLCPDCMETHYKDDAWYQEYIQSAGNKKG